MGVDLDAATAGALVALFDRLTLEPQNLSAIDHAPEAVDRHLADSLVAVTVPEVRSAQTLVDVGSGGGFPGLVLARVLPDCAVTLVESERRKADWLARAGADSPNVRVVADRAESLAKREREAWQVVTARAIAATPVLLELAAPLLAVGGVLVAWRGSSDADPAPADLTAAAELGLRHEESRAVRPFPGAERALVLWRKTAATPARYPRRPGRAAKRPIA